MTMRCRLCWSNASNYYQRIIIMLSTRLHKILINRCSNYIQVFPQKFCESHFVPDCGQHDLGKDELKSKTPTECELHGIVVWIRDGSRHAYDKLHTCRYEMTPSTEPVKQWPQKHRNPFDAESFWRNVNMCLCFTSFSILRGLRLLKLSLMEVCVLEYDIVYCKVNFAKASFRWNDVETNAWTIQRECLFSNTKGENLHIGKISFAVIVYLVLHEQHYEYMLMNIKGTSANRKSALSESGNLICWVPPDKYFIIGYPHLGNSL